MAQEFAPSRSQRRVLKRWPDDARVEVDNVGWSEEKLALFNKHKVGRGLANPEEPEMSAVGYMSWLVQSCFETIEMRYYIGERLIGVGIVDVGLHASSSVYFYFDPDPEVARLSPGVYSVLQEVRIAQETGRRYHYLGLWVGDCRQLNYKTDYAPHELLIEGDWRRQGDGGKG